jgi:hypothetical protein
MRGSPPLVLLSAAGVRTSGTKKWRGQKRPLYVTQVCLPLHNVVLITGRAGTEPRSTDRNHTAGPVRCIGGLCHAAGRP